MQESFYLLLRVLPELHLHFSLNQKEHQEGIEFCSILKAAGTPGEACGGATVYSPETH